MGNIVVYKNMAKFIDDFRPKMQKLIGRGCEGVTYTDGVDAYKMYIYNYPKNEYYRNDISQIITTEDYDLPSFTFPKTLYLVDKLLMGTRSTFIPNDIFHNWKQYKDIEVIRSLDFDSLISAYYKMLEDIEYLTNHGVEINDLAGNMVFDGKSLVGVDTCFYDKKSSLSLKKLHDYNVHGINVALAYYFSFLVSKYPELSTYFENVNSKTDIITGIDKVKSILK